MTEQTKIADKITLSAPAGEVLRTVADHVGFPGDAEGVKQFCAGQAHAAAIRMDNAVNAAGAAAARAEVFTHLLVAGLFASFQAKQGTAQQLESPNGKGTSDAART